MKKAFAFMVLLMVFVPLKLSAQSSAVVGNGLQISPSIIELRANPGETIETTIRVRNVTSDPVVAITQVNDFIAEDENGTPTFIFEEDETDPNPYGLKDYITSANQVTLDTLEQKDIRVEISIPQDANPGGHYAVVRFTAIPPGSDISGFQLSASVGTLILVNVEGEITENIDILDFGVAHYKNTDGIIEAREIGSFFRRGQFAAITRIENTGNSHVKPIATIELKNMFGNTVSTIELNNPPRNVLPNSVRKFTNVLPDKFYFGKYTLSSSIAYGEGGGNIITVSDTFWVVPYDMLAILAILLMGVFYVGRVFKRRYDEKVIARARQRR